MCHSIAEVDEQLDHAHAASSPQQPALAVITHQGYGICLGLGIDPTVLEIHYPPYGGEYYTSVGDPWPDELVDFFGHEGHFQYPRSTFIPLVDARRAVREFIATGRRSEAIRWRDCRGDDERPNDEMEGRA